MRSSFSQDPMAAWHWAGLAISWEVLQLKVRANQENLLTYSMMDFQKMVLKRAFISSTFSHSAITKAITLTPP
ncbi:hypothetical protein [Xanthomonas oryzae]|uniref:hypothetical protein n=1 Tax=Xanthomonas oryzae TaxID=347 RepID=UPI003D75AA4F